MKESITPIGRWVVYRHIRKDKNLPFYIGIGKDPKRPYSKKYRNKAWLGVVDKTDYNIDILFENLTKHQAITKEKEFIKLYGRVDIKTGCLYNMTDGGEGAFSMIYTDDRNKKISNTLKGRKHKKETIIKNRLSHSNRWNIKINGKKYNSIREAAEILNISRNTIKYRILSNNFKDYERKEN